MVVTRAMANSSKNHALLMCRIWKIGWNLFSSFDIRENSLFFTAVFIILLIFDFGQENFQISCILVQKCHFGKKWKIAKMALLNPCMKVESLLGQKHSFEAIWKWQLKNVHNMSQGLPNPWFMQEKVQKGDFLKKPSRELKIYFCHLNL